MPLDEDSIKPLLEKYIGSLPGNSVKENFKDLGIRPPSGKVEKVINKGSEPQSIVNIVFTSQDENVYPVITQYN